MLTPFLPSSLPSFIPQVPFLGFYFQSVKVGQQYTSQPAGGKDSHEMVTMVWAKEDRGDERGGRGDRLWLLFCFCFFV